MESKKQPPPLLWNIFWPTLLTSGQETPPPPCLFPVYSVVVLAAIWGMAAVWPTQWAVVSAVATRSWVWIPWVLFWKSWRLLFVFFNPASCPAAFRLRQILITQGDRMLTLALILDETWWFEVRPQPNCGSPGPPVRNRSLSFPWIWPWLTDVAIVAPPPPPQPPPDRWPAARGRCSGLLLRVVGLRGPTTACPPRGGGEVRLCLNVLW